MRDLIEAAHGLGLAVAQKNTVELIGTAPFDFAVTESCLLHDECSEYTRAYSVVLDVEYVEELSSPTFQARCAAATAGGRAPSFVFHDLSVSPGGVRRWCSGQPVPDSSTATTSPSTSTFAASPVATTGTSTSPTASATSPTTDRPTKSVTPARRVWRPPAVRRREAARPVRGSFPECRSGERMV